MERPATRLRLRVSPGAARSELVGRHGDAWKVRLAAPPADGRANEALLQLLAERLAVPRRDLALVSGLSARDKIVELTGVDSDELDRRLSLAEGSPTR